MADYDRKPTINGHDADAADGADLIGQLARAPGSDGANVGDTGPLECDEFEIVFEREDSQDTRH